MERKKSKYTLTRPIHQGIQPNCPHEHVCLSADPLAHLSTRLYISLCYPRFHPTSSHLIRSPVHRVNCRPLCRFANPSARSHVCRHSSIRPTTRPLSRQPAVSLLRQPASRSLFNQSGVLFGEGFCPGWAVVSPVQLSVHRLLASPSVHRLIQSTPLLASLPVPPSSPASVRMLAHQTIRQFVCLNARPPIHLSTRLPVHPPARQSVCTPCSKGITTFIRHTSGCRSAYPADGARVGPSVCLRHAGQQPTPQFVYPLARRPSHQPVRSSTRQAAVCLSVRLLPVRQPFRLLFRSAPIRSLALINSTTHPLCTGSPAYLIARTFPSPPPGPQTSERTYERVENRYEILSHPG